MFLSYLQMITIIQIHFDSYKSLYLCVLLNKSPPGFLLWINELMMQEEEKRENSL